MLLQANLQSNKSKRSKYCLTNYLRMFLADLLLQKMAQQYNKHKVFSRLRDRGSPDKQQRHTQRMFINFNSGNASPNSSFVRQMSTVRNEENKQSIFHTLSARKFHNNPQFTLAQLNITVEEEPKQPEKKKAKGQPQNEKKDTPKNQIRSKGEQPSKQYNKTLSTLLDINNKPEDRTKIKCKECQTFIKTKQQQNEHLAKQLKQWQNKYKSLQDKYQALQKSFTPYISNMNMLSAVVDTIQQKEKEIIINEIIEEQKNNPYEMSSQMQETSKVNKWLLRQGREKDKFYHTQTFRLNCQIDVMRTQNQKLKNVLSVKQNKIKGLEQQLRYYQSNNSMRERLQMCREELYTYKLKYQERYIETDVLSKKLQEMKYKLTILTSLIGCAIIFDLKEKQNDKHNLKEFMNKIDKYETITHNILENNGFQYLKFYENMKNQAHERPESKGHGRGEKNNQEKQNVITRTVQYRKLFFPNYLVLLGEETLASRTEHVIIKPLLFIKIRAMLDSKYIDYRIFQDTATQFPDFCNSYLKNYDILQAQKKPYLLIRQISENQIKEMNIDFFKCLLDQRIQDLPQIQIFREFILSKWEEDQIYFYLMCRHKFMEGSELQNFINSGDPSKFIKFDKAKRLVLKLTESFGRNIQNFICHHINQRKIIKNRQEFIRVYYLLKVLLLIYHKIRVKKVEEFREYFQSVLQVTKKTFLNFLQFNELLKKNFEFLNRSDSCRMYKITYALFESQKNQPNFYECFVASCLSKIFLKELIRLDKQLEFDCMISQQILGFTTAAAPKIEKRSSCSYKLNSSQLRMTSSVQSSQRNTHTSNFKNTVKINQLNELWPDSVYILGNEALNKQYVELMKNSNHQQPRIKLQMLSFLTTLAHAHFIKQNIYLKDKDELNIVLTDSIDNMIQYLNKIEKHKLEYENEVNLASKKIGRFFKNKVYEFYHQMLEDVNNIKAKTVDNSIANKSKADVKKSKRYFKEKIRASKVFGAFKLN